MPSTDRPITTTQVLSTSTEDYLKNIWLISEHTGASAGVSEIASRMLLGTSTVSEAVKKLAQQGLVAHSRYSGVDLTDAGRRIAVSMVRKHRLIETFLVQELGYQLEEVHDEAEALEHAVSDLFIARIEKVLNYPVADPHGDPIPNASGEVSHHKLTALSASDASATVEVMRVSDHSPEVLSYLRERQILPGTLLTVCDNSPSLGLVVVDVARRDGTSERLSLACSVAENIWAQPVLD